MKGVRIDRYRTGRFWGVWFQEEFLAVVVYKKGAMAIRDGLWMEKEQKNVASDGHPVPDQERAGSRGGRPKKGVPSI